MQLINGKALITTAEYDDLKERGQILTAARGVEGFLFRGYFYAIEVVPE